MSYEVPCLDGTQRSVRIQVNKCGGQDAKTITYTAPYDPASYIPVFLELKTEVVTGGDLARLDLSLGPPQVMGTMQKGTIRITYDPACCTFSGLDVSTGLLKDIPHSLQFGPGWIEITSTQPYQLTGGGVLGTFDFLASDPEQDMECPVEIESWTLDHGCLNPRFQSGKILIVARKPQLACDLSIPDTLVWDRGANDYTPNPLQATITVLNNGNREARNAKARIILPADSSLELVYPKSDTQAFSPTNISAYAQNSAGWSVRVKEKMKGDSAQICIETWADNHALVRCCRKVYIPPVGPRLACSIGAEKVTIDTKTHRYTPMPFTVYDTTRNTGGLPTDTVFTTIILPPGLFLANQAGNS